MSDEGITGLIKSGPVSQIVDLLHKLAGPATDQIGQMLGDKAWAYRMKNLIAVTQKAQKRLLAAGLPANAIPPRLLLPIVENSSVEDDPTLQEMWAGLLATASKESDSMTPAFIETLKQLTPSEAAELENIYRNLIEDGEFKPFATVFPDHHETFLRLGLIEKEWESVLYEHNERVKSEMDWHLSLTNYGV